MVNPNDPLFKAIKLIVRGWTNNPNLPLGTPRMVNADLTVITVDTMGGFAILIWRIVTGFHRNNELTTTSLIVGTV